MLDTKTADAGTITCDVATVALRGARDYQEDSIIAHFPLGQCSGFAVVADGVGGHGNGAVASALVAAEVFSQLKLKEVDLEDGLLNIPAALHDAVEAANDRMAAHILQDQETQGMGSTLLAMVFRDGKLNWASVGDSVLMLFRGGTLRRLNKDHSMAPQIDMMVKTGAMSEDVGRDHPDRHTLTSAIQGEQIRMVDCPARPIALMPGDIVISSSDGLLSLPTRTIAKILNLSQLDGSRAIAQALSAALIEQNSPDQDNTSFSVVRLVDDNDDAQDLEAEDMPVLAMAEEDAPATQATAKSQKQAEAPPPPQDMAGSMDLSDVTQEDDREGRAYWYRGQKYYRD